MESLSQEITIKIKTLDKEFSVKMQNKSKIQALKEKIQEVSILII